MFLGNLHYEDSEAMEEIAQRSGGCLIFESGLSQVRWGFEQPPFYSILHFMLLLK